MLAIDSSPFGHPRAEARTQTSLCCSVSPAAVRSKRTTPKHVLRSEGRSERGTDSFPFGISFRFGMECLAHSGVGGDASRTHKRAYSLPYRFHALCLHNGGQPL
jgi:hypothetical protein